VKCGECYILLKRQRSSKFIRCDVPQTMPVSCSVALCAVVVQPRNSTSVNHVILHRSNSPTYYIPTYTTVCARVQLTCGVL